MTSQNVQSTNLKGVFVVARPVFPDERGSFQEVFRLGELEQAHGEPIIIRQINKSVSKSNVLRGLHIAPWGEVGLLLFWGCFSGRGRCSEKF
ncbi:dTDP-4-dehydrorhamnose 3,5-epimerase family protein [Candidatus Gottesmanbacteria bacterium]|nr:dTDP-4-dehydrorhamnose 3,5-epimerase family protein [Candidatus Gottesmanbacteria bacterium]